MRFSRSWPCAVPMRVTPRSAIVRHAAASSSVPISSTMISGVWFSTASIITRCCCEVGHLHGARRLAGCGTSVAPISLLVSMITTLVVHVAQHARELADDRGLPHPRPPEKQDALAAFGEKIFDHVDVSLERATDPAGEPHHRSVAVADRGDAVQRALDAGAVVPAEIADRRDGGVQVAASHGLGAEALIGRAGEARLRAAPEVEHDFQQIAAARVRQQHVAHVHREHLWFGIHKAFGREKRRETRVSQRRARVGESASRRVSVARRRGAKREEKKKTPSTNGHMSVCLRARRQVI